MTYNWRTFPVTRCIAAAALIATFTLASLGSALAADAPFQGMKIASVGVVTYDVEKTAHRFAAVFGAPSWSVYEEDVEISTFRNGKRENYRATLKTAVGKAKDRQFELIQEVKGETPFGQFYAQRGSVAAHHFSVGEIANAADVLRRLKSLKYDELMEIRRPDGSTVIYLDTGTRLGAPLTFVRAATGPSTRKPTRILTFDEPGLASLADKNLVQLAFVVPDAAATLKPYAELFGLELRQLKATFSHLIDQDVPYRANVDLKVFLSKFADINVEIIEPTIGNSAWMRFLRKNVTGIQHMAISGVQDPVAMEAAFRNAGYVVNVGGDFSLARDGADGSSRFVYMDTFDLGFDIEFVVGGNTGY